jgi:hypothetical protein
MNILVEEYIDEMYLREDLSSIMAKIQSKKTAFFSALKEQNPEKLKALLSGLPQFPVDKLHDLSSRHIPGFQLEYDKAIKKQTGTPEERQIKATTIAIVYAIKKNVKIPEIRKELTDIKIDPAYAFVARDIFTGLCLIALAYMGYIGIGAAWGAAGSVVAGIGTGLGWLAGIVVTIALIALGITIAATFISGAAAIMVRVN